VGGGLVRREPTDDDGEGTLSVASRIDNTGDDPLIIVDSFGDPYTMTIHALGEETSALIVARLIKGNTGKTAAWVAAPTRRHIVTLGGRQTGHDVSLDDEGRLLADALDAARDLVAAMGDRAADVRLVWDPDSRLAETDTL